MPELVIDRDTEQGFYFPNTPRQGVLYFGASPDDTLGEGDLYVAHQKDDEWDIAHLEPPFNTSNFEWDPFVAPDGDYLLFESRREDGLGGTDIYVAFEEDDGWGPPINLGSVINTEAFETAATITPDGAYMFFTRVMRGQEPQIYWVSTDVIKHMRQKDAHAPD